MTSMAASHHGARVPVMAALPRIRQAVLVARDLEPTVERIRTELGVAEPFRDPGVGHFGLHNAVFTVGDTFLEVVSPVQEGTAAGRYLDRRGGDGGYMIMFQVADIAAARSRIADLGVRVVHDMAHDDIVDIHLHPKDVPGAIVAVDACDPEGSWRWGGPAWEGTVPEHAPGGVAGVTVAAVDPAHVEQRWSAVVGVPVADVGVRFTAVDDARQEGIVGVTVATTQPGRTLEIAGVRFDLVPVES